MQLFYSDKLKRAFISERVDITRQFEKCPEIDAHVRHYGDQLKDKLQEVISYSSVPLDCRFTRIRTEETAIGNFVVDIMRTECDADFAMINAGCLRANMVYPEGQLQLRFLD